MPVQIEKEPSSIHFFHAEGYCDSLRCLRAHSAAVQVPKGSWAVSRLLLSLLLMVTFLGVELGLGSSSERELPSVK